MPERYLVNNHDYGDGSDGTVVLSTHVDTDRQEYEYVELTINNGGEIDIQQDDTPVIIRAQERITVSGLIDADHSGFRGIDGPGVRLYDGFRAVNPGQFFNRSTGTLAQFNRSYTSPGLDLPVAQILDMDLTSLPKGGSGSRGFFSTDSAPTFTGGGIFCLVAPDIVINRGAILRSSGGGGGGGFGIGVGRSAPGIVILIGHDITINDGATIEDGLMIFHTGEYINESEDITEHIFVNEMLTSPRIGL